MVRFAIEVEIRPYLVDGSVIVLSGRDVYEFIHNNKFEFIRPTIDPRMEAEESVVDRLFPLENGNLLVSRVDYQPDKYVADHSYILTKTDILYDTIEELRSMIKEKFNLDLVFEIIEERSYATYENDDE